MKMIKNISSLIALLLIATTFNGYSMEPQRPNIGWIALAGAAIIGGYVAYKQFLSYIDKEPTEPFPFTALPFDKQYLIITLLTEKNNATSLKEAAKTINSLAQTEKYLNELINDPEFCLTLIKHLAKEFNCSDEQAAEALQTQEAKRRLELQNKLPNAVFDNNINMVTKLYQAGYVVIDLDFIYSQFKGLKTFTALWVAAQNNNCPMIQLLLSYGADINKGNNKGITALMAATYMGKIEAIECLLNHPTIAIDQQDIDGETALMTAAQFNSCSVIQMLLKYGANINMANYNGRTALMTAVANRRRKVVKCLLSNPNVAIDQQNSMGETALMLAAQHPGDQEIIDLIQDAIAEKHAQNKGINQ